MTAYPAAKLKKAIRYIRGITFKPTDKVETDSPNAVICTRTKNIQQSFDDSDLIAVTKSFVKRDEQYLRTKDILISSANSWNLVGKCVQVPELNYTATAGGFISIVRADEKLVDADYLYRWLSSGPIQHKVRSCSRQTTNISNLSTEQFLDLEISLPPLPEQRRIAAILDKADAIRRKRQESIKLTEDLLRSTFLDMFGDPESNAKSWHIQKLESLLLMPLRNGLSPSSSGTVEGKVLTLSAITRDKFLPDMVKSAKFAARNDSSKFVDLKDFLICRGNGNISLMGKGRFPSADLSDTYFPDTMIAARIDTKQITKPFLESVWSTDLVRKQLEQSARTTNGTHKINQTSLNNIRIINPPIELQEKYVQAEKHIHKLHSNMDDLEYDNLFNSLVQRAFKGEL